jgi:hypothetical protein
MEKFEQDGDRKRAIKDIQSLMESLKLTAKQAMDVRYLFLNSRNT